MARLRGLSTSRPRWRVAK
ncbi:N-ethylammeline chlorohydrolase [Streptococcus pneumoniae SPNA45]|nr:N-ethylammeline chlorohydrolase [Streptococcus pneumoniae SPNA45]